MDDCIFCGIASGERPSHMLWEDEDHLAFLDINPINPGHCLLIPRRHVGYVFDMAQGEYAELFERARQLAEPLRIATGAERVGIMVEGFKVPHVHVHLVPINDHTELNPYNAGPAESAELGRMADRIRAVL